MMTTEQIFELIKRSNKPYLSLKRKDGYGAVNAGSYNCENCSQDEKDKSKVDKAIKWLQEYIILFPKDTVFFVYMKSSANANQSGVIGPFDFSMKPEPEGKKPERGLSGIMTAEQMKQGGYLPESEVKAQLAELRLDFERKEHQRVIEGLTRRFDDTIDAVKQASTDWSPDKMASFAETVAGIFHGKPAQKALSGTEKENKEPDLKEAAIKSLAECLYENASIKDVEKIHKLINKPEDKKNE